MVVVLLPILATLLGRVAAADFNYNLAGNSGGPGTSNSTFGTPRICAANAGSPNITGSQTIAPDILEGGKSTNLSFTPVSWRTTVYQPRPKPGDASRTELSLWFDTNGANYTDNYDLGWDVCYFWMLPFTVNTFLRAQKDKGDCLTTLDATCIKDMSNAATDAARLLVGLPTPGPDSNLTANSLPSVCAKIASIVNSNFPSSCATYFNGSASLSAGPPALGGALTGPKSLVAASQCKTKYGSLIWTQIGAADSDTYTLSTWWITGILTVFLPIADYARPVTLPQATAVATCLRANTVEPGSLAPFDAPLPTPLSTSSSPNNGTTSTANGSDGSSSKALSTGGIVGLAIGVCAGLLLIALGAFLCFRKRRRQRQVSAAASSHGSVEMDGKSSLLQHRFPSEAPNLNTFYEMSSHHHAAELPSKSAMAPVELPAPVERTPSQTHIGVNR